ncbi:MAG: class I adenylate-forming enzyme family protein [Acidimicrobiales bacterium]
MRTTELPGRIGEVLAVDPAADVVEFEGSWRTWGQLADTVAQAAALVGQPGVEVGVLLRNRPASIGLLLGVLRAGGCVVTINPGRGRDRTRDDIASLDLPVVAGEPEDLAEFVPDVARATTAAVEDLGTRFSLVPGRGGDGGSGRPETAVRMLTSGTTGPPKRVDLTYRTLERVLVGAKHYESNRDASVRLRRGVAIVNSPLVHLGGLFRVLQCVSDGRPFCLLERFTVEGWADAVRRHHPATASLVPAALRMVLEADLDPADLSSIRSVISGTAPLDPDDADAFMAKYGIPVLVTYAATEFGGSVAGWSLEDHGVFWRAKRGSVGRAHSGCELRVVDQQTGRPVAADTEGLLEVKAGQLGDGRWVRTTDLGRLDADGFLFIVGRADQAIIRGGFKVRPEDIRAALERHPGVRGAAVVSRADRRLGAVPVAAVELRGGAAPPRPDELLAYSSTVLARYELPVEIRILDDLPRTESGKVDLGAVTALFHARQEDSRPDEEGVGTGATRDGDESGVP